MILVLVAREILRVYLTREGVVANKVGERFVLTYPLLQSAELISLSRYVDDLQSKLC